MMNLQEVAAAMIAARQNGMPETGNTLTKVGIDQSFGLTNYDLQPVALKLYPVITPLRNEIARVMGNGDTATHWKAITAINTSNQHIGVSEGNRGALISSTLSPLMAKYVGFGLEQSVSFEGELAAMGFDNARAVASLMLLQSMMIGEEKHLIFGNGSHALTKTPKPAVSVVTTGGSIADGTYNVAAVALTALGLERSSLANGVVGLITKVNTDHTTDYINGGAAQQSDTTSTGAISGSNHNIITAHVAPVEGAVAFAWFVGTAGSEKLEAITTINSVSLKALAGTGQLLSAAPTTDMSADSAFDYNGLFHWAQAGLGSTISQLATGVDGVGSHLTSDGSGGCAEISAVCQKMWDNFKLGPQEIWVSSVEALALNKLIVSNGSAPLIRMNIDAPGAVGVGYTIVEGKMLNPITGQLMRVRVHPDAVQGTILMYATMIPYPLSGVGNIFQVKCRRDYYQIEWPWRSRKYETGVYVDSVLQHYFPPSLATITNIAA